VQRAAWTDERLDDLADAMRTGFGRIDQDIRDLRTEVGALRTDLRGEMREGFANLRGEINDLRLLMLRVGGGVMIALVGVIAAILARGV
jgi:hypothetical protein